MKTALPRRKAAKESQAGNGLPAWPSYHLSAQASSSLHAGVASNAGHFMASHAPHASVSSSCNRS